MCPFVTCQLLSFYDDNQQFTKLASSASVATNAKKRPNRCLRLGRFFKLVEAPPKSPRTQNVFRNAVFQTAATRFFESLMFKIFLWNLISPRLAHSDFLKFAFIRKFRKNPVRRCGRYVE